MKIQRLICKSCGSVFAVSVDVGASAVWYKEVARCIGNNSSIVETIEHPNGSPFNGIKPGKCCRKKVKIKTTYD